MNNFPDERWFFYGLTALSLLLPKLPVVGVFFRIINTMIHETGHAAAALLVNGEVVRIDLLHDTSGTAITRSGGKLAQAIVSISGYVVSSVAAWLMFMAVLSGKEKWILFALLSVAVVNLLLWVRNAFGIIWLLVFISLCLSVSFYENELIERAFVIFCSGVVLFDSVSSAWVLLYLAWKHPKQAGDARNLAQSTGIPTVLWALFFVLQSLFFAALITKMYWEAINGNRWLTTTLSL